MSALHDDALHEVPSLVADFKLKEFHKAENESVQYCRHVLSKLCVVTPILIMPGCLEKFSLCLCVPDSNSLNNEVKEIALMEICCSDINNTEQFAQFLCATKYAIDNLIKVERCVFRVEPWEGYKANYSFNERVHMIGSTVCKFYDTKYHTGSPNFDVIRQIDENDNYLPGLKLDNLTDDGRFLYLQYNHIVSKSFQYCLEFLPIMETLDKLHHKDLVHSDVWHENLVCSATSKLLDFDLCDKVGNLYPSTYNYQNIEERHWDAKNGNPRCKSHDQYSILYVIKKSDIILSEDP